MFCKASGVLVVVVALATCGQALAADCGVGVKISAGGPVPETVRVSVNDPVIWWVRGPSTASKVTFHDVFCSIAFSANAPDGGESAGCGFPTVGTYSYSITGFGAGTGTVIVLPPPLTALSSTVVFGHSVSLLGEFPLGPDIGCFWGGPMNPTPPPLLSRNAEVLAEEFGQTVFHPLAAVTALGPRGAFALTVAPTIETTYQARLGALSGLTTTVEVRPRVRLRRAGAWFRVQAQAAHSLAGAHVWVQVRSARAPWQTSTMLELDPMGSASFHAPRGGSRLRVFMPAGEAGPGYVAGFSRTLSL